jgi:hypothetical protein
MNLLRYSARLQVANPPSAKVESVPHILLCDGKQNKELKKLFRMDSETQMILSNELLNITKK